MLIAIALSDICTAPQKQFYLSYNAISNRDYLTNMFENISQAYPTYNMNYTDKDGTVYTIIDLKPHLYYN
jgi:hypothetical protein